MVAQRSRSVRFHPVVIDDEECKTLAQWSYCRWITNRFGRALSSYFVSIVTRPGLDGYWVCKPYYIYSGGPRRFRRLPRRIERVLVILHWRTVAIDAVRSMGNAVKRAWRAYGLPALRRRYHEWCAKREMKKMFPDIHW